MLGIHDESAVLVAGSRLEWRYHGWVMTNFAYGPNIADEIAIQMMKALCKWQRLVGFQQSSARYYGVQCDRHVDLAFREPNWCATDT